jgi:peptide/nickel transport system substrate-binding protein
MKSVGGALAASALAAYFPTSVLPHARAAAAVSAPRRGGSLKLAVSRDVLTFDPFNLSTGLLWHNLYDVLTRYDESGTPQPRLAQSWALEDGGRRLVVRLRPGVQFHNGRPVVAEDVVFTVRRAQDPRVAANIRPLALYVRDVQARDERTIVFSFDRPNLGIFDLFDLMFIQNRETIDTIRNSAVGTGPFKLARWEPGSSIRLVRNENWWRSGLPYLDEVVVQVAPDPQAMLVQLEARAVDMVQTPPVRELRRLRGRGFKVISAPPGAETYGIVLNVTRRPFDNPRVREAIKWAIDRQRFVDTVLGGEGEVWCTPWPRHSIAYSADLARTCGFDLDRAKRLLTEAGYSNGFDATYTTSTTDDLAPIVAADLAKLGVRVRIDALEEAVFRPKRVSGDFDMSSAIYVRANKDPSSLLGTTLFWNPVSGNSQFRDPEYTRLINEGLTTVDPEKRKQIYRQITQIIVEKNFVLPVSPSVRSWAMQERVRDFAASLDGYEAFEAAWLG